MFGFTTLPMAVAALALFTPASSLVIPRKAAPAGWWTEGLENYDVYHTRYLALSCQTQHNTDFFDACCHPMLATENLVDNRASYCTPSASASSSAVAAEPTSTVDTGDEGTDEDEDYEWVCDDDEEDDDTPEPSSTKEDTPEPTSTKKVEGAVKDNTPTSIKEAEPTSTKEAEPTSTKEATPTSEDTPEPTETSGGDNNGGSGAYGGEITWYEQGGAAGACGDFHSDSDDIAAISFNMYGNIGAKSGLCGKQLKITNPANHKSVTVTIADACESCADNHIDLSTGAFNKIADPEQGQLDISIQWL